ncbi:SDR family NAD(P)-dependent oxidoreductase [Streptomyces sp. CHA1]|uniref:oxidoreductase n=1 Tax=unclassified Streptomyces TaxID=2593676 RepID=UPI001BFC55B4|nr:MULTISPECIES: oxidoreductase [unclassified Streptomyces]MBT3161351.1 SDR family NAD(P)-dependent oxidoreductase [Streptomyces sp. G11C]MCO6699783.1 SDR family NAD(P)-dependent oxidoreductase [Streptomyces sp. CHB9.2]MCO6708943.1 SDR family NAD(P)-dependent oxidoreductase [Streptomyces sp. CHA3]MCO6714815.1 SDR family NAD(P)-dependent oxidoreductase [Streptomyces sp. CHB19.2]MCO6720937.1 SDR family NAD(P)-dependent oxidoreductase [Streptomyces sp. Vc714c-19]
MSRFSLADLPDLTGRTAVVTGANSGIGLVTARVLAEHGARVVLAVRDPEKGEAAAATMAGPVQVRALDLADLSSVRAFAGETSGPVDLLVNNAGLSLGPLSRTADGFELQFGTNHLGHFALTNLLLPRIRGRVVTVASLGHRIGSLDFTDLQWERKPYRPNAAYAQSKLANLLFAAELQRRLTRAGSPVISTAAHPGISSTNLMRAERKPSFGLRFEKFLVGLVAQSAEEGALPTLYAATADLPGDSYAGPDRLWGMRGAPTLVGRSARARDSSAARLLWDVSQTLTGTRFPLDAPATPVS